MHPSHIFVIRLAFMKIVAEILEKPNKKATPVTISCKRIKHKDWIVTDNRTENFGVGEFALAALTDYSKKIQGKSIVPLEMNLIRESGTIKMTLGTGKDGVDYGVCNNN